MTSGRTRTYDLAPVRTVAPADLPVTLAEAKLHCRVDHADDDTLITGLIEAATGHLDGWTGILGRAIMTQTWRQDFPNFGSKLRLPLVPAALIEAVTYHDGDNSEQTLDDAVYSLFIDAAGPYVALRPDQTWPGTYNRPDAVSVEYVAGADDVLPAIKAAILLLIGHWYVNRDEDVPEPPAIGRLLRPLSRVGV